MKREILFRGLRTDGKGWVYGDLVQWKTRGKCAILPQEGDEWTNPFDFEVNPATVGQFTGVTDCDDRKVFEGDIIDYNLKGFLLIVDFIGGCFVLSGPDYPKPMRGTTTQGRVVSNIHKQ